MPGRATQSVLYLLGAGQPVVGVQACGAAPDDVLSSFGPM